MNLKLDRFSRINIGLIMFGIGVGNVGTTHGLGSIASGVILALGAALYASAFDS